MNKRLRPFLVVDVASLKGVKPDSVRSAIRRGAVQAQKVGPLWLIRESEVARYLRTRPGRPSSSRDGKQ